MAPSPQICECCKQTIPEPKHVWLSTTQVIDQYGFDPRPFIETLKSKIVVAPSIYSPGDSTVIRVWLKAAVEYKAESLEAK